MTPEESVAAYAEWIVERWFAYVGTTTTFAGFWDSIASQVTVAVLRDAARILKITNPGKTRAAMALLVAEGVVAETVVSTHIHLNRARGMYTARLLKCDVVAWQPV